MEQLLQPSALTLNDESGSAPPGGSEPLDPIVFSRFHAE